MNCLIVYSSVSGNTKAVAEAILEVMPTGTAIVPVQKAPDPAGYDFLALGFWVHRSRPDPRMCRYMEQVHGKTVAWFGTMAAWPDSDSARQVRANADALLVGNRLAGGFLCQGRLTDKRFTAIMDPIHSTSRHPMTEERRARLLEAAKHPNEQDFAAARALFQEFLKN